MNLILSVKTLNERLLLEAGWSVQPPQPNLTRPTRGTSNRNIRLPQKSGWIGKMIQTKRLEAWNRLPLEIKLESKKSKAKTMIKKYLKKLFHVD